MTSSYIVALLLVVLSTATLIESRWRPCVEVKRDLRIPCQCAVAVSGLNRSALGLEIDCDRMILVDDALASLDEQPIISFSQRHVGHQSLPTQLINLMPETLEKLDLSGNAIHRMMDRQLQGRIYLKELRLADNALGDNLNPIFSSNEFDDLASLRLLDLRSNGLKSIEEGIFKECRHLEELYLDFNNLTAPPTDSLKGPKVLRVLSLAGNNIATIHQAAFTALGQSLLRLDLSNNELLHVEDNALIGLKNLLLLNISYNDLHRLNSDVFKGAYNLKQLDISDNFLEEFPTDALRHQPDLQFLDISNNLITELQRHHLDSFTDLQVLDLSRNNIGRLGVNVFSDLKSLVRLDLSFNALRAIDESSFEGLTNLKWLSLQDNNILLVPSAALARLPSLVHLHLEYNRIAALSSEILRASASHLITFSLTRNLVRELPPRLFLHFNRLTSIDLSGNMIPIINKQTFVGVEDTLVHLDLSSNRLAAVEEIPLRKLVSLNLAENHLKSLAPTTFRYLERLQHLNISNNPLYGGFPPIFPRSLISLDVSRTGLHVLPAILLLNLESLEFISIAGNKLKQLSEGTFKNLANLTSIDLSHNDIADVENAAFIGLLNLRSLNLRGNKLRNFKGEYFNTGTSLESLDLSHNELEYLSPTAFLIHPRLRKINLSDNRFTVFPSELIKTLQFLGTLDLSNNRLSVIGEFAFAQVARLRDLNLSDNRIESVDELAFHNSTQLQKLDLSKNRLENLSERSVEGVIRMEKLNLRDNRLASLPDSIFDTTRIRSLEQIDISGNKFVEIPARSLNTQTASLVTLNIARNRLSEIFTQEIINSVKHLDLSCNPLSENAIRGVLSEAKVLRSLNVAGCGIHKVQKLEAPFLRHLNLSDNDLETIEPASLERATILEGLDVSKNKLKTFNVISRAFSMKTPLKTLDVSNNDISIVNESSLISFDELKELKMHSLANCSRIEKNAFKSLTKVRNLQAYNYPKLGYFDVQGIVKAMSNLQILDIEIKDLNAGNEQLSVREHPRLKSLTLRGDRLRNVSSSLLVGIKSSQLYIGLKNTSIDKVPTTLLFPVPRSTQIQFDVEGSRFKAISTQLMSAFEDRSWSVKLKGLDIKVKCDCEAKQLWRWCKTLTPSADNSIICSSPTHLEGQSIVDLSEEQLTCESKKSSTIIGRTTNGETTPATRRPTVSEPEIIWTVAPTQDNKIVKHNGGESTVNTAGNVVNSTDDTLIYCIIAGVVVFIVIAVAIICLCVKSNRCMNQENEMPMRPGTMAQSIHDQAMFQQAAAAGSVYGGKQSQDLYSFNGSTIGHNNNMPMSATPVQMLPLMQPMQMMQSPGTPQPIYGYYDGSPLPIYITSPSENKFDR